MKFKITLLLFFVVIIKANATHWYVNNSATGLNNGTSWVDAFTDLQSGLGAAIAGDSVWVAQGVYKPTATTTRTISFVIPSSIRVFGGFAGTETILSQRDVVNNVTTLSGNIGNTTLSTDNSYTVVNIVNASSSTRLDGFKIINGHNTVGSFQGSGLNNKNGSPTVANCIFQDNYSSYNGGALCSTGSGSIVIKGSTFLFNNAAIYGGGLYLDAHALIQDCIIKDNLASNAAGGIYVDGGNVNIDRCIITKNEATAGHSGGIGVSDLASVNLTNSLIVGNRSDWAAAMYIKSLGNTKTNTIINCTFANNHSSLGLGNNDYPIATSDYTHIYNCILADNTGSFNNQFFKRATANFEYNLIQGGVFGGTISSTNIFSNPKFNNAGITITAPFDATLFDYHLNSLSKGIDAGKNSYIIPIYNFDADSINRIFAGTTDIGAYEKNYCSFPISFTSANGTDSICWGKRLSVTASPGKYFQWSTLDTTATGKLIAGKNYLLAVDSLGCRSKDSFTVKNFLIPVSIVASGTTTFCTGKSVTLSTSPTFNSYLWSTGSTASTLTVLTTKNCVVTVTDTSGCKGMTSQQVTVTPIPVTITVSGPTSFCAGGNVTLGTSQVFNSYSWSNSSTTPSINVTTSANYSVNVTDGNGCTGSASQNVVAYPLPIPVITQNGSDLSTTINYNTYQWYRNGFLLNGEINPTFTPTQDGNYTVQVTNNNNCSGISTSFSVLGLAVVNASKNNSFSIYPNPASSNVFIKDFVFYRYEIKNLLGQIIYSSSSITNSIDVSQLKSGTYFLFLYDAKNNLSTTKFVKE